MRLKKHIALRFFRALYHLKSIGLLFFPPLVIINILVPALNIMEYLAFGGNDSLYISILQYTQWLFPFSSVWWVLFVLREYLESDGNELLYVHADRCKWKDCVCLFVPSLCNIGLVFGAYAALLDGIGYEFLRIGSICVFYLGLTYFLAYLSKSVTITLLTLIFYTLANLIFGMAHTVFPLYYTLQKLTPALYVRVYLPMLLAGLALFAAGGLLNQKRLKFI